MEAAAVTAADRMIGALRAAWYAATEWRKLRRLRARHLTGNRYDTDGIVSVYIPTYNRADLLMSRALPSVLRQTYPVFEVIVVADGCTDDTVARVKELGDYRVRVVEIKRGRRYPPTARNHWFAGRVAAANAGLEACEGDWIATIDDDDVWAEDHIESSLEFAAKGNYEFVSSDHITVRDGKTQVVREPVGGIQTWVYRSYLKHFKFNPSCWRKRWNAVCDTDLQDRFEKAGVRMGRHPKITCSVMPRPGESTVGLDAWLRTESDRTRRFAI